MDTFIGWVVLFLVVTGLGWCTTRPEGPAEHSVKWFLERPSDMEHYVEKCRGVMLSDGTIARSAWELSDPEACINADEAWAASGKKIPGPI